MAEWNFARTLFSYLDIVPEIDLLRSQALATLLSVASVSLRENRSSVGCQSKGIIIQF
jgi:hypothetical protein